MRRDRLISDSERLSKLELPGFRLEDIPIPEIHSSRVTFLIHPSS